MKPAGPTKKTGTTAVAYSGPENGPFQCGRCVHFMPASASDKEGAHDECWHPKVIADPEMEHDDDGHAMVDAEGCCEYFRPGKTITQAKANRLMTSEEKTTGAARIMGSKKK